MSIKETIKFNGADTFIKVPMSICNDLVDFQQEIDNTTEEAKEESINPIIDYEVRKYTYAGTSATELEFFFGTAHDVDFVDAGFTLNEINSRSNKLLNSFFILDFYDSFDDQAQTKIFTTYLTQVVDGETDGGVQIPKYRINHDTANQFFSWYVPKDYLDPYIYSGYSTIRGDVKFSFYNAKTGKVSLFYNKASDTLMTPEKMYFETYLYPPTMGWQFITDTPQAYEVSSLSAYAQRVNDRVGSFNNLQQQYPSGDVFDREDGTYFTE